MAAEPMLFFKSLHQQTEAPEGRWCRDLRSVEHILLRLVKTAGEVLSPHLSIFEKRSLMTTFNDASRAFERLKRTLRSLTHENANRPRHRHRH
jgi:hypothetical protein